MRKLVLLTLFVFFALALQAQDSGTMTIKGCLHYARHRYELIDASHQKFQLTGYATKLKPMVNREVEIVGREGTETINNTQEGTASSVKEVHVIHVSSVKQIADTCTSGDQ